MNISLIAAVGNNRVIGMKNAMPWHMPADLKHFKRITLGKPVVMGRKTFDAIGRPLPGRTNIIVTRDPDWRAEGCVVVYSVEQALQAAAGAVAPGILPPATLVHPCTSEVMVIGGANLFEQLLPRATRIYLTEIKADFAGDSYFPVLPPGHWLERERQDHPADTGNPYPYSFVILDRAQPAA